MKKVTIFICGEVANKCSANGCLKSFNNRTESFEKYKEEGAALVSFNTCPGCNQQPIENLKEKIEKFKKSQTDVVHISTCIRGRCPNYEEFADMIAAEGIDVVGYTHGSEAGKKSNTIWIENDKKRRYEE